MNSKKDEYMDIKINGWMMFSPMYMNIKIN